MIESDSHQDINFRTGDQENNHETLPKTESPEQAKEIVRTQLESLAGDFDYSDFSFHKLYEKLKSYRGEFQIGGDINIFDIESFETGELEPVWSIIDEKLQARLQELEKKALEDPEKSRLLKTGDWQLDFDGRLIPRTENPVVLGGVHGDEPTLPDEVKRFIRFNEQTPFLSLNNSRAYINHRVNPFALEHGVRAYSPEQEVALDESDMNRPTSDQSVQEVKAAVLESIGKLNQPMVIDFHNHSESEKMPYSWIVDDGSMSSGKISDKLLREIKTAMELGIEKIYIVDPEMVQGQMIEEVKKYNPKADGMVVEVNKADSDLTSIKTALSFFAKNRVLNDGRPSVSLQLAHVFGSELPEPAKDSNTTLRWYALNHDVDDELEPRYEQPGHEYQILNGQPVDIRTLSFLDLKHARE